MGGKPPSQKFFHKPIDNSPKVWYNIGTVKERRVANDGKGTEKRGENP